MNTATTPTLGSTDLAAPTTRPISTRRVAIAAAAGTAANLAVLWIGSASGATMQIDAPYPVTALTVALFSALPMALAALVVAFVARRRPGFVTFAAWAGLAFALLTAAMPFVASPDGPTALTLAAMHVVIGAAWFSAIRPTLAR